MRRAWCAIVAVASVGLAPLIHGQDLKTDMEHKLEGKVVLTRFTADHTDIVKPGSVLVFHKPALVMFSVDNVLPPTSSYQNGKLTMGFGTSLEAMKTGDNRVTQRTFVEGEKFWFAGSTVEDNAVFVIVISDPFNDVRYWAKLKFPYNKKSPPTADQMLNTIAEVITADTGGDQNAAQQQQPPPAPPQGQAGLAPIAPPPPPADAPPAQPKTIAIGQSTVLVVAILGQPEKMVNLGPKAIYIYKDLKVTFVNGKVSDVQ
jgi:hypothetical protein